MVPSHQSTSSFPLFGKHFTVDVNQTDSAPSSRPPINDDCHFMVGRTPGEGGWPGILAPAVNPTGQHKPEGSRGRHLRGCAHFKLQCLTFAQAEAVVINQIWQRGWCGQMQTSSGCSLLEFASLIRDQNGGVCLSLTMSSHHPSQIAKDSNSNF